MTDHTLELARCLRTVFGMYGAHRTTARPLQTAYAREGDIDVSYNGRNFVVFLDATHDPPVFRDAKVSLICTTPTRCAWEIPYTARHWQ